MSHIKLVGVKDPLPISQIMYATGDGNYSTVFMTNGKRIVSSMTLARVEEQSAQLLRIHKRTLVNPDFVTHAPTARQVRGKLLAMLTMSDERQFPVARRRHEVMDALRPEAV